MSEETRELNVLDEGICRYLAIPVTASGLNRTISRQSWKAVEAFKEYTNSGMTYEEAAEKIAEERECREPKTLEETCDFLDIGGVSPEGKRTLSDQDWAALNVFGGYVESGMAYEEAREKVAESYT